MEYEAIKNEDILLCKKKKGHMKRCSQHTIKKNKR